ncbi:HAD family hydrolase [Halomarina oriensis]|uniref:HAD-IA family hydrolase n=1 Tax=Halomarina oriensis TaxID=671145 RepID=A0A6B0GJJ8_9EURY|nr:HAD-IA family hydrolase [Halomarina oriensis]
MSRFRAVLFDMDGVLVDSERHWNRFWREEVFADARRGTPTLDDVTGRNYHESLGELVEAYDLPNGVGHYAARFDEHAVGVYGERVSLTPGVGELFAEGRRRALRVGIVSSAPHDWIRTVVDRFGLEPLDTVVSAEDIDGPGKPAPGIYEHAAAQVGVAPEACVVVEDSVSGVRAADAAGATVVRFQRDEATTAIDGADAVAEDSDALRETVLELLDGK